MRIISAKPTKLVPVLPRFKVRLTPKGRRWKWWEGYWFAGVKVSGLAVSRTVSIAVSREGTMLAEFLIEHGTCPGRLLLPFPISFSGRIPLFAQCAAADGRPIRAGVEALVMVGERGRRPALRPMPSE